MSSGTTTGIPSHSSPSGREPGRGQTVAIMQPYFVPYAGYFRLLAATDLFVIYDCVQFPRRGWVHRNQLHDAAGAAQWLTLPLQKAPQEVLIRDLAFREDAAAEMAAQLRRFPAMTAPGAEALAAMLRDPAGTPVDHIERLLRFAAERLGLPWRTLRSSSLGIDSALRGQERILAIAQRLGATCYVNAPGGRALYDPARFAEAGIALRFLPPHEGGFASIAERLATEEPAAIAAEIQAGCRLLP